MKILGVIILGPHLSASGAVNAALGLSDEIGKKCDMSVATMATKIDYSKYENINLMIMNSKNILNFTKSILPERFRTLLYRTSISQLINDKNYDLVHIHNPIPTLEMKKVAMACIKNDIPYVVSSHGFNEILFGKDAYKLTKWYENFAWEYLIQKPFKYVLNHANKIFALSPFEIESICSMGVEEKNIVVVTNGVNEYFFNDPNSNVTEIVKEKFNFNNLTIPTFVYLGNHTKNKGIDFLLKSFLKIEGAFRLIICGKKRSHINYSFYENQSSQTRKFIFTNLISDSEILSIFKLSDYFVYPTLADTLPLVILEAMATGLPIISSRVGGIPYQVSNKNGHLFTPGDVTEFTTLINKLIKDYSENKKSNLSNNSISIIKNRFRWKIIAPIAMSHYRQIIYQS